MSPTEQYFNNSNAADLSPNNQQFSEVISLASEIDKRRELDELLKTITLLKILENSISLEQQNIAKEQGINPSESRIWKSDNEKVYGEDQNYYPEILDEEGEARIQELTIKLNGILVQSRLSNSIVNDANIIPDMYDIAEFVNSLSHRLRSTIDELQNDEMMDTMYEIGKKTVEQALAEYYPDQA